jgi:hypothetical protein
VLRQFLSDSRQELVKQLLSVDLGTDNQTTRKQETDVAVLIAKINLIGSIEELPKLLENIKKENEKFEALKIRAKKFGED